MKIQEFFRIRNLYLTLGSILVILIAGAAIWWVFAFLFPMPSRIVAMATGPQGGTYAELGSRTGRFWHVKVSSFGC